jgi:hypothetical protein
MVPSERERIKRWKREHPEQFRAQIKRHREKINARNKALILEAKNHPCVDCGQRYPVAVMEFDHVPERGPKLSNIAGPGYKTVSRVLAEIAKCDVVCANCHRIRTEERRGV